MFSYFKNSYACLLNFKDVIERHKTLEREGFKPSPTPKSFNTIPLFKYLTIAILETTRVSSTTICRFFLCRGGFETLPLQNFVILNFLISILLSLSLTLTALATPLSLSPQDVTQPTLEALKTKVEAAVWQALTENAPTLEGLEPAKTRIRWKIPANRPLPMRATVQQATCFTSTPKIEVTGAGLVQCRFGGKAQSIVGIPFELEQQLPVAVITQTVEPRTTLEGKFKQATQWIPLITKAKLAMVEATPNWASTTFSKQLLPVGTVLLQQHLSQPPAVQAQEAVTVQLIIQSLNAPVKMTLKGIALEAGRIGQSIPVKCNHMTNKNAGNTTFSGYHFAGNSSTTGEKIYRGIITEKSTVVVHL